MKNANGFTLLEVLIALGIMSMMMAFLINGIYYIENMFHQNQSTLEMGGILQSNMETILSSNQNPVNKTYSYQDYIVKVTVDPYGDTNLLKVILVIANNDSKKITGVALYEPKNE